MRRPGYLAGWEGFGRSGARGFHVGRFFPGFRWSASNYWWPMPYPTYDCQPGYYRRIEDSVCVPAPSLLD